MLKRLIGRIMGPWRRMRKASQEYSGPIDVILALDFGMRLSDSPLPDDPVCASNRAMAELACQFVQFHPSVRLVVQEEIRCEIMARHPAIDQARMIIIPEREIRSSGYLDTRGFLHQAVSRVKRLERNENRQFNNVLLICHHAHLWRAKRTLEQVLFEARLRSIAVRIPPRDQLKAIPYDRQSFQWWTRGPVCWWLRELLVAIPWYKVRRWI